MTMPHKNRVAVLRGGPCLEHDVSMRTGSGVLATLASSPFVTKDIVITKGGEWLVHGFVKTPEQALIDIDVVFIALHGAYGEDGTVQRILERLGMPYTGSGSFASAIAMNKVLTKEFLKKEANSIKMAPHIKVTKDGVANVTQLSNSIMQLFGPEYVIKPIRGGSSIGTVIASKGSLLRSIVQALEENDEIIVEKRIHGKEATVGILENFRSERYYRLPEIEIVPPANTEFFSADVKYTGQTQEICPGRFSRTEKDELLEMAKNVHILLGLKQYSRSDFIVAEDGIYFLEVNTLPNIGKYSTFSTALASVGASDTELFEHLLVNCH
jgi:D-alanine-D-alanine ligase